MLYVWYLKKGGDWDTIHEEMLYVWYPKKQGDWDTIHKENDVFKMTEDLVSVKKQLKQGKHTCLVMRMEHPRAYKIVL